MTDAETVARLDLREQARRFTPGQKSAVIAVYVARYCGPYDPAAAMELERQANAVDDALGRPHCIAINDAASLAILEGASNGK